VSKAAAVAAVISTVVPVASATVNGGAGVQTRQGYFTVTYVPVKCHTASCRIPAKGAVVKVSNAAGRRIFTLTTAANGRTDTVTFPIGRLSMVVQPRPYKGHTWSALKFHASSPWAGTAPVQFALQFCLASKTTC
jgi:hypothetical protein